MSRTPDRTTHRPSRLPDSGCVALSDLTGAEQWFVRALRAIVASYAGVYGASQAAHEESRDATGDAGPALQRFVAAACEAEVVGTCTTAGAGGNGVSSFEAHVLHAVACLQSGLLGEAWKTLVRVCSTSAAGRALLPLDEVAAALERTGRHFERWRLDDAAIPSRT